MQARLLDVPPVVTDRERADEWADRLEDLLPGAGRIFPRADLRRRAAACVRGLLGSLSRKNGWQLAEYAGDTRPDGQQHLLDRARWDVDELRDFVRRYVVAGLADGGAELGPGGAGVLGRRLGLRVPELVRLQFDPVIGLGEPDQEIQDLLKASGGLNLGMDFLPGSLGFDPLAFEVDPAEAGRVVWFDALIGNVDRSWRNPNMLIWHRDLWLIDHGASLIWHHNWKSAEQAAARPYDAGDHALSRFSPDPTAAAAELASEVTAALLREVTAHVPDEWLACEPGFDGPDEVRRAYERVLLARAASVHERISLAPKQQEKQAPPQWLSTWVEEKAKRT